MNYIPELNSAFYQAGFRYRQTEAAHELRFVGSISTHSHGLVYIELVFEDEALLRFPRAYIKEESREDFIPYHFPHLDGNWQLCYEDSSKIFDFLNPMGMVEFIIESLIGVIDSTRNDDMAEILPEFVSYWNPNIYGSIYGDFLDDEDDLNWSGDWIFGKNPSIVSNLKSIRKVKKYKIPRTPSILGVDWPINNLASLKKWLSDYWPIFNKIMKYIEDCIRIKQCSIIILLHFEDTGYFAGITLVFENPLILKKDPSVFQLKTIRRLSQNPTSLKRFWVERYSPERFILSSIPKDYPTLIDKRIVLVGAGTIGSNLANILVRSGAGCGKNGLLHIIDPDSFSPHNLSRHWLGLDSIGKEKAAAMADDLKRLVPFARIEGSGVEVQRSDFTGYDLVIDSTGEESLTSYLTHELQQIRMPPFFVASWVKSDGSAVEVFCRTGNNNACHECLRACEIYQPMSNMVFPIRDSCRSVFVPFPITAALSAAILTVHIVDRWLRGEINKSLYCVQMVSPLGSVLETQVEQKKGCAICGNVSEME